MSEYLQLIRQMKKTAAENKGSLGDVADLYPLPDEGTAPPEAAPSLGDVADAVPPPDVIPSDVSEAPPKSWKGEPLPEPTEGDTLKEIDKVIEKETQPTEEEPQEEEKPEVTVDQMITAITKFMTYMGDKPASPPKDIDEAFDMFMKTYQMENHNNKWYSLPSLEEIKSGIQKIRNSILGEEKRIAPGMDPRNPKKIKLLGLLRNTRLKLLENIESYWTKEWIKINSEWKYPWGNEEKEEGEESLSSAGFNAIAKYFATTKLYDPAKLTDEKIQKLMTIVQSDLAVKQDAGDAVLEFLDQDPDPITVRLYEIKMAAKNQNMWERVQVEAPPEIDTEAENLTPEEKKKLEEEKKKLPKYSPKATKSTSKISKKNNEIKYLKKIKLKERKTLIDQIKDKIIKYLDKTSNFGFKENPLEAHKLYQKMLDVYMSYVLFHIIKILKDPKKRKKMKGFNDFLTKDLDPKNVFKQMGPGFTTDDVDFFTAHLDSQGYIPTIIDWMSKVFQGKWTENEYTKEMLQKAGNINNPGETNNIFDNEGKELNFFLRGLLSKIIQRFMNVDQDISIPTGHKEKIKREKKLKEKKEPVADAENVSPPEETGSLGDIPPPDEITPTEEAGSLGDIPPPDTLNEDLTKGIERPEIPQAERRDINDLYSRVTNHFKMLLAGKGKSGNINLTDMFTENEQLKNREMRHIQFMFSNFFNSVRRKALETKYKTKTMKEFEKRNINSSVDLIEQYVLDIGIKDDELSNKIFSLFYLIGTDMGLSEDFVEEVNVKAAELKELKKKEEMAKKGKE